MFRIVILMVIINLIVAFKVENSTSAIGSIGVVINHYDVESVNDTKCLEDLEIKFPYTLSNGTEYIVIGYLQKYGDIAYTKSSDVISCPRTQM